MGKRSLVVLAAGMGSRFGGIKQIEPVGPSGEILADYAIYDAIRCGFERVVFIIKKEHLEIFKDTICKNFMNKIEVCFAFQELDNIPSDVNMPLGRTKMWGTTHALLSAEPYVDDAFIMINADDFNGMDTYMKAKEFFDNNNNENEYITVNYPYCVTASENGTVKRAVVLTKNNIVENMIESEIGLIDGKVIAKPLNGKDAFEIDNDQPVAVNFFGLKPSIFKYLHEDFNTFIHGNINETCECLMPETLKANIESGRITLYEGVSNADWFGMTYREDVPMVKERILKLVKKGDYPKNLWG